MRRQGMVQESMELFRQANLLNPNSVDALKQIGRSLYLLGKFKLSMDCFAECLKQAPDDWEIYHNQGLCYFAEKNYTMSVDMFKKANLIEKHNVTSSIMGKAFEMMNNSKDAIATYIEALDYTPEN